MISRRTFLGMIGVVPVLARLNLRLASVRPVVVVTSFVAGYRFYGGPANESRLRTGQCLVLRREPVNPDDALAVAIDHPDGFRLGYLPRRCNAEPARLLDQGVPATISHWLPSPRREQRVKVEVERSASNGGRSWPC